MENNSNFIFNPILNSKSKDKSNNQQNNNQNQQNNNQNQQNNNNSGYTDQNFSFGIPADRNLTKVGYLEDPLEESSSSTLFFQPKEKIISSSQAKFNSFSEQPTTVWSREALLKITDNCNNSSNFGYSNQNDQPHFQFPKLDNSNDMNIEHCYTDKQEKNNIFNLNNNIKNVDVYSYNLGEEYLSEGEYFQDKECQTPPLIDAFGSFSDQEEDIKNQKTMHLSCGKDMLDIATKVLENEKNSKFKKTSKESLNFQMNNWNESFQKLIENFSTDSEEELSRTKKLQKTCQDFADTAKKIGKIIISELFLKEKTIKPITDQVGGIAGGAKYFQEGIFFKLPIDDHGIYGGNEGIFKSAGHELRHLMTLLDCRVQGIHTPMVVLVDFRGWRLLAESLLPLSQKSLILGSSNGGKTIMSNDKALEEKVKLLSHSLNLQGECVMSVEKKKQFLYLSCDIEGHKGTDGRFYLVDTARLFPPTQPTKKSDWLIKLMRPEFVKNNPEPLCADSFSGFGLQNKEKHNEEIKKATRRLEETLIPEFAQVLEEQFSNTSTFQGENQSGTFNLKQSYENFLNQSNNNNNYNFLKQKFKNEKILEYFGNQMHRIGINLRYLGLVTFHLKNEQLLIWFYTEISARSIKNITRAEMRSLDTDKESDYNLVLARNLFNTFSALRSNTFSPFWERIGTIAKLNYGTSVTRDPIDFKFSKDSIDWWLLYLRLSNLLGFKLKTPLKTSQDLHQFIDTLSSQPPSKILYMYPIIKHLHRVFFEEATALTRAAIKKGSYEMFQAAAVKYQQALERKPNDYKSLSNWGYLLYMQATLKIYSSEGNNLEDLELIDGLLSDAQKKFEESLAIEPKGYKTLKKLGDCLVERANIIKFSALKINPVDDDIFFSLGNLFSRQSRVFPEQAEKLLKEACNHYQTADKLKPNCEEILINWATSQHALSRFYSKDKKQTENLLEHAEQNLNSVISKNTLSDQKRSQAFFIYASVLLSKTTLNNFSDPTILSKIGEHYEISIQLNQKNEKVLLNWLRFLIFLLNYPQILDENLKKLHSLLLKLPQFSKQISLLKEFFAIDVEKQFSTFISFLDEFSKEKLESMEIVSDENEQNLNFLEKISKKIINYQQSSKALAKDVFTFLQTIGGGRDSHVYKARRKDDLEGVFYAIKVIKKEFLKKEPKSLNPEHPFIAQLLYSLLIEERYYLVFDYLNFNFFSVLKEVKKFSERTSSIYISEIYLAIRFLHKNGIVYKDLTPANIFLQENGYIKIIQKFEKIERLDETVNSTLCQYLAPELLMAEEEFFGAEDFWTLGVLAYLFISGKNLFYAETLEQVTQKILSLTSISFNDDFSPNSRLFISQLLNADVKSRMDFATEKLSTDPFFNNLDFSSVFNLNIPVDLKPRDLNKSKLLTNSSERLLSQNNIDLIGFTFAKKKTDEHENNNNNNK